MVPQSTARALWVKDKDMTIPCMKISKTKKQEKMQISGLTDRKCCDIVIKVVCDHAEDSRCQRLLQPEA